MAKSEYCQNQLLYQTVHLYSTVFGNICIKQHNSVLRRQRYVCNKMPKTAEVAVWYKIAGNVFVTKLNHVASHREQQSALLPFASTIQTTQSRARHPAVNADAGIN